MKACNHYTSLIVEVASGAAGEGDRLRLEDHTSSCAACAAELDRLRAIVGAVRVEKADPGGAFWDGYFDRLSARMPGASERALETSPGRTAGSTMRLELERLADLLLPRQRRAWQLVAAVLLVAVGVLLGRSLRSPAEAEHPLAAGSTDLESIEQAALASRTEAYLDRSKTLLLGFVGFDPAEDDPSLFNVDRRRAIAGELVREAGYLEARLSESDERRLHELVSDLEIILLQIANIESAYDLPEIEIVKNGLDRKAILFKIDVEEMRRFDAAATEAPSSEPDPVL